LGATQKRVELALNVYTIEFTPAAARQLRKLPRQVQSQLSPVVDALALDPRPHGAIKLTDVTFAGNEMVAKGTALYRLRSGDYRIIYTLEDQQLVVVVVSVADRKEVYR